MADDDIDLDAMLDSALDEGFADPAAAQTGDEDCGDIDLDAMLDEAMVASVLDNGDGNGEATAEKSRLQQSVATYSSVLVAMQLKCINGLRSGVSGCNRNSNCRNFRPPAEITILL